MSSIAARPPVAWDSNGFAYAFEQATHVRVPPQFLATTSAAATSKAHGAVTRGPDHAPARGRKGLPMR